MTSWKKNILVALASGSIALLFNIAGGYYNDLHGTPFYGISRVIEAMPFQLEFAFVLWLTGLFRWRIRHSVRWPLLRIPVWLALVYLPLHKNPLQEMATSDFIEAAVPPFCFWIYPIESALKRCDLLAGPEVCFFGLVILGVSLYQFVLAEIGTYVVRSCSRKALSFQTHSKTW